MSRKMIALALVLGASSAAYGQQVVSYAVDGVGDMMIIPSVEEPVVLTDVVVSYHAGLREYRLVQDDGQTQEVIFGFSSGWNQAAGTPAYDNSYHLNSGIPIPAGVNISVDVSGSSQTPYVMTLSGYIPAAPGSGAVPAVSSWGVGIMMLVIIGAASVAFRRVRAA